MQSQLMNELLQSMNSHLIGVIVQFVLVGIVFMYVKDLTNKIFEYFKMRVSNFSRGVKVEIFGKQGYISHMGFDEVEIEIDESSTLVIPVRNFMKANKVIIYDKKPKRKS